MLIKIRKACKQISAQGTGGKESKPKVKGKCKGSAEKGALRKLKEESEDEYLVLQTSVELVPEDEHFHQ